MIDQISVVMPSYNAMPFLKAAVESILMQSFKDFEFLIVNDGSTDESKDYLDSLSDPRIRVIHQTRAGVETALNTGIRQAKHEWIARMDADDIALPRRLEKEVQFLNVNPSYVLVSCAFGYIGTNNRRLKATHVQCLQCPPSYKPMVDPVILHQGVLYRKHPVVAVGAYRELAPAEDLDLWLRLGERSYEMACIPDILMLVRVLPGGISATNFIAQRVAWKYAFACADARRDGVEEPIRKSFSQEQWPRGWKRLRMEGARQFRLGGADWGAGRFLRAALRLSLAFLLRPDYVLSKFRTYFFAGAPSPETRTP
jgi:glycosyltransferase involved in cell wall biosynthesis